MKRLITKQPMNVGGVLGKAKESKIIMAMTAANHCFSVQYHPDAQELDEDNEPVFDENGEAVMIPVEATVKHTVEASFRYTTEDGQTIPAEGGTVFNLPRGEITVLTLWDAIKDNVPEGLNFEKRFEAEVLEAARFQMASTIGIAPTDIEEII